MAAAQVRDMTVEETIERLKSLAGGAQEGK
jgi:hypothetical protein